MRRTAQLLTSIASLTIAMALLVLGVYSSVNARLISLTGTVEFTAQNTYATVRVYSVEPQVAKVTTSNYTTYAVVENLKGTIEFTEVQQNPPVNSVAISGLAFTDTKVEFAVIVEIENTFPVGGRPISITPTDSPLTLPTGLSKNVLATQYTAPLENGNLVAGAKAFYIFTFTLNSMSAPNFPSTQILNVSFSMERK